MRNISISEAQLQAAIRLQTYRIEQTNFLQGHQLSHVNINPRFSSLIASHRYCKPPIQEQSRTVRTSPHTMLIYNKSQSRKPFMYHAQSDAIFKSQNLLHMLSAQLLTCITSRILHSQLVAYTSTRST
jgi:hypothetical protein